MKHIVSAQLRLNYRAKFNEILWDVGVYDVDVHLIFCMHNRLPYLHNNRVFCFHCLCLYLAYLLSNQYRILRNG